MAMKKRLPEQDLGRQRKLERQQNELHQGHLLRKRVLLNPQ